MKKRGLLFLLVLTFAAGYFSNSLIVGSEQLNTTNEVIKNALPIVHRDESIPCENTQVRVNAKENIKPVKLLSNQKSENGSSSIQSSVSDEKVVEKKSSQYPNEITDEEIDKILPPPFNQKLKNNHGYIREKYREFADATEQKEFDINIQNKLTDAISSNPYSKFLNIESLVCKANICEIRLYETKRGVWSYIQAEMHLQDWWPFGNSSASGFNTNTPKTTGWYVLLVKR
jgi:hypothetical protein